MITREQIYDLVNSMKAHTLSALKENQRSKLPIIIDDEDKFFDTDGILHSEKCKISTVKKYHYREKWYYYKYSVDRPEETFGILKVENLPYRSFYDKQEKQSFISSMERMVSQSYVAPFMVFLDNKFVNWNDIDIVFDCGETYLLLHGEKYNWYNLTLVKKFNIIVLPFKVEYIGVQSDESFNLNLSAFTDYIQRSLEIKNNNVVIKVPTMETEYMYDDNLYNIGSWLYRQIRLNYLGLLSKDKVDRLKKISITKYDENESGTKVNTYTTRFNALDRDVYDKEVYDSLCYMDLNNYANHKLFSFNEDGYLDDNGCNTFYMLTDKMYYDHFSSSNKVIYNDHNHIKNILQRENYLVFKNGELFIDCEIKTGLNNLMRIVNKDEEKHDIFTFYHLDADQVYQTTSFKFSQDYLNAKAKEYFDLSRKVQDGVMAILMNDDGSDSDRIIKRLDTAFLDRFYTDYYDGIVYINEQYNLLALLMGEDGEFTGERIKGLDFGPKYEYENVIINGDHTNNLIAKIIDDNSKLNGLVIKSSFILVDPKTNDKIELISASDDRLYAKVVQGDNLEEKKANAPFMLIDPDCAPIAFIDNDTQAIAFDPKYRNLGGKYVIVKNEDSDESKPSVLVNGGMFADIFDRSGQPKDERFKGEFLLIDLSVDYGIIFIDKGMFAMGINDDDTFNGNNIENIIFENIGDSNIMPLSGSVLLDYKDAEINDYVLRCMECLDFMLSDTLPYLDNMNNAIDAIINYDATIFNRLNHTNIESSITTGKEANRNLNIPLGHEMRRGLKIPRQKFYNHETFCMVFLNGELLEQYSKMIAYHDFFFIPIDEDFEFDDNDEIEFLYFLNCDNNEIQFKLTEHILTNKLGQVNLKDLTALMPNNSTELMDGSMQDSIKSLSDAKLRYRFITSDGIYMEDKNNDNIIVNKVKADIFSSFIRPEDLKIFEKYPKNIMEYSEIIEPSDDLAFNVSFSEDGETYIYPYVLENTNDTFTAVSKRKFIYQRLYVDYKSYRIKLAKRFRYCDNQKQYMLFINGRRIYEESFFVTTPKYSRPFWGTYLYLTKFVTPEDRIEIFYVPEEMNNINRDNSVVLSEDGYIEADKTTLDVPYDNKLYMFFINGKKLNPDNIAMVNSSILRIRKDTNTLMPLVINKVYNDTMPEVVDYMHDPERLSAYDSLVYQIRNSHYLGKEELDKLFEIYVHMSDIEENMLKQNIGRIAAINEIVRDFWVTSGYPYHEKPFIYDYDLDEIIYKDKDGNYILPALDANYEINIRKNDTHLLYFTADPDVKFCERGSILNLIKFIWDYSLSLYNDSMNLNLISQTINDVSIDTDARSYDWQYPIKENTDFLFTGNTGHKLLQDKYSVKFVDPIYYGLINEDAFKHYRRNSIISLEDLIALVPKNGILPSEKEMLRHMEIPYILEDLRKDYYIFRDLMLVKEKYINTDYIFIDDLIAIIPDNWRELMNGTMDIIAEEGLEEVLKRYKYMTFDNLLLVDPNEEPIEFLKWLKAIIPADEKDVMGYPDRLTSKDGIILIDDHIDSIFAILQRSDGRYNGKRIYNLDTIYDDSPWSFLEFIDGAYAIKMDSNGLLTNDIIEDITFVNTDKNVIKGFHYIKEENQEWDKFQFIDDLMVLTNTRKMKRSKVVDANGKLTFINTDMSIIDNLDYIKELLPKGVELVDNLIGFLLDNDGNETTSTIINLSSDEDIAQSNSMAMESDESGNNAGLDTIKQMIYGIPTDVDPDNLLENAVYATIIDDDGNETGIMLDVLNGKPSGIHLDTVDFSRIIALTMNDKGEFLKDLINPPKDKEMIFYLGDDNDTTMLAIADPEHYDRSAKTDNIEFIDDGFDIYAMLMDDLGNYTGRVIHNVLGIDDLSHNENAQFLDDTIYANILDSEGNDTGKIINFLDYVGAKHSSVAKKDRVDRIIDLYDCLLLDPNLVSDLVFTKSLTAILADDELLMSGLMEAKSNEQTMDDLMATYKYIPSDFILMNNNEEPLYMINSKLMAIIPADEKDVMGYPDRLTSKDGIILIDDHIDSIFAITMRKDGRYAGKRITNLMLYDESPWDLFEVLDNGVYAIKLDINGLLTNDTIEDLTFTNTDRSVIHKFNYIKEENQEWDKFQFIDDLLTITDSRSYTSDSKLTFVNTDISVIKDLDYIKELLPPGITLIDNLVSFLLDNDGNETNKTIENFSYDEDDNVYSNESFNGNYSGGYAKVQLNGIPSDVKEEDIMDGMVYGSIIDDDGNETGLIFDVYSGIKISDTGSIILDEENINNIIALTMNDKGEFLKDLINPPKDKEPIIYLNENNNIFAIANPETYDRSANANSKHEEIFGKNRIDALVMDSNGNYTGKVIYNILGDISYDEESIHFLTNSIYANILDSEGNETGKIIDLINYVGGKYDYLDRKDRGDRIIYFDDYLLMDTIVTDAVFTKTLTAILADSETTVSGIIERQYDSKTLAELAEVFKTISAEFLLVDPNQIPLEFLKWLSAIVPTDYDELMGEENDPEILLKHLKGLNLSDGMIYNPHTDTTTSYSGFMAILLNEDGSISDKIIHDIGIASKDPEIKDIYPIGDIVNIDDLDLFAMLENGDRIYTKFDILDVNGNANSMSDRELNSVIAHIDKYLQDTPEVDIKYPIGNHNYFIYAIPKYYVYNKFMEKNIRFNLQDLKDRNFLLHTLNQSTPIYTSGNVDADNNLESLNYMNMICLGETDFTSEYGITERYVVWRTNGYFTRIQEDYGVKFQVQNIA